MSEPYMQRQVLVDPFGNTMTRDVEVYDAEIVSEEYEGGEESVSGNDEWMDARRTNEYQRDRRLDKKSI